MSDSLKKQLRDYFEFVDEEQGAVDVTALEKSRRVQQSVRPGQTPVQETTEPWHEMPGDVEGLEDDMWTRFKRPLVAAAAMLAVAVPVAVGLFLILSSSDTVPDVRTPAGNAPTTTVSPVIEPEAEALVEVEVSTVDEALAVADAYFEGRNAGDADSVMALLAPDTMLVDSFSFGNVGRVEWELDLVWDLAQGTILTSPECTVVDDQAAVTIRCVHGTHDAPGQAVGSPLIPTRTRMTVTPDGISDLFEAYGTPDFTHTGFPFRRWMEANHPDDADATGCCAGDTVEESTARGELRAQYAQEWAAYLEANECDYRDPCGGDDEASEDPEAALTAYAEARTAGDIDALVALFAEDAVIVGHPFAPGEEIDLAVFESLERNLANSQASTELSNIEADGNSATFTQTFVSPGFGCYATDGHQVTMADGKITRFVLNLDGSDPPNC